MRIVYFAHSLASCWNHGNAHFLRGVARSLKRLGCEVAVYEPANGWSLAHLVESEGPAALAPYLAAYPDLSSIAYGEDFDPADAVAHADLVIAHEWNAPDLIARLGRARARGGRFTLLFHDTHHRLISDPEAMAAFDLSAFDGVLAFGESLAEAWRRAGWGRSVHVWREAADVSVFRPPAVETERAGLIWIGNWGDEERSAELVEYLLRPSAQAGLPLEIHGVRYPPGALDLLAAYGARYCGWLANAAAPAAYARRLASVHVPRRFYAERLPGIPTIRVFETLACGIPLACAPWSDSEGLFYGDEYLIAADGAAMTAHLRALAADPGLRAELRRNGLRTITERHTCDHRARELLAIAQGIGPSPQATPALEMAG